METMAENIVEKVRSDDEFKYYSNKQIVNDVSTVRSFIEEQF